MWGALSDDGKPVAQGPSMDDRLRLRFVGKGRGAGYECDEASILTNTSAGTCPHFNA